MNKKLTGALQVAMAAVCWSFAGVFCKWIPWGFLSLNGFRSLFGAIFLFIVFRGQKIRMTRGNWLGALGVSSTSLLFMAATKLTSSANAIVLQYAMPVVVIAFCWIFYRQKPTGMHIATALSIMIGVVLCALEGMSQGNLLGDALALLSAVTFAMVFFCSRLPDASSREYSMLGFLINIPFCLYAFFDPAMTLVPTHWLAIIAMALCLAGGYYFIAKGLNNTSPTSAALLSNLEPVLNPFWVFLFLGDAPGRLTLVGAVIVLVAATVYSILGTRES